MYIPSIYKNENPEEIRAFLKANAFGILVTSKDGKSCATHIPLELAQRPDGSEYIHGHISKANEQVAHLINDTEVLCIFNGPHSYVSASWYDYEEVSTWNYIAVHLRGTLRILDEAALIASVSQLMHTYEASQEHPIAVSALSEKTMRQVKGIVGFEITITSIEAAFKLSQGQSATNHASIRTHLKSQGGTQEEGIAQAMKEQRVKKDSNKID